MLLLTWTLMWRPGPWSGGRQQKVCREHQLVNGAGHRPSASAAFQRACSLLTAELLLPSCQTSPESSQTWRRRRQCPRGHPKRNSGLLGAGDHQERKDFHDSRWSEGGTVAQSMQGLEHLRRHHLNKRGQTEKYGLGQSPFSIASLITQSHK